MAAKVLIIGPQRCGKTRIANCLSDFEASPNFEQYNQTSGVRILESERVIRVEGRSVRQQVPSRPACSRFATVLTGTRTHCRAGRALGLLWRQKVRKLLAGHPA
jgi:ABC-type branched-subunit amino acid transport system ATPase component